MDRNVLLKLIKGSGKSVAGIEKELDMPAGTLAKAINLKSKRGLPDKWDVKMLGLKRGAAVTVDTTTVITDATEVKEPMVSEEEYFKSLSKISEQGILLDGFIEVADFCREERITLLELMQSYKSDRTEKFYKRPDSGLACLIPKPIPSKYLQERQNKMMGK